MDEQERARREETVRRWFRMWLERRDTGIGTIFAPEAVYVESWGPEYRGAEQIAHWFREWNSRGRVTHWQIRSFLHSGDRTAVEWYFQDRMDSGAEEAFDGVSLIEWTREGRIARLQEFGCRLGRYDPYRNGPEPEFQGETVPWL